MTSRDFVLFSYERVLGRAPAEPELACAIRDLELGRQSREQLLVDLLASEEVGRRCHVGLTGEFVPAGHFYSVSILLFPGLLARRSRGWFEQHVPAFVRNEGGSIWLRRDA